MNKNGVAVQGSGTRSYEGTLDVPGGNVVGCAVDFRDTSAYGFEKVLALPQNGFAQASITADETSIIEKVACKKVPGLTCTITLKGRKTPKLISRELVDQGQPTLMKFTPQRGQRLGNKDMAQRRAHADAEIPINRLRGW